MCVSTTTTKHTTATAGQKKCCLKTNGARRDKPSFSMEQSPNGLASRYNLHDKGSSPRWQRHSKQSRHILMWWSNCCVNWAKYRWTVLGKWIPMGIYRQEEGSNCKTYIQSICGAYIHCLSSGHCGNHQIRTSGALNSKHRVSRESSTSSHNLW